MDFFSSKLNQHKEEARNNSIDDAKQTMNSVAKKMGWKNIQIIKIDLNLNSAVETRHALSLLK
jgi:uncharacterized protein YggE